MKRIGNESHHKVSHLDAGLRQQLAVAVVLAVTLHVVEIGRRLGRSVRRVALLVLLLAQDVLQLQTMKIGFFFLNAQL